VIVAWGAYYDVVDTDTDGILDEDRKIFTLYKMDIRRSMKHEAWRRVEQP